MKTKKIVAIYSCVIVAIIVCTCFFVVQPIRYSDANELYEYGEYEKAMTIFERLGNYRNSDVKAKESRYAFGLELENEGNYVDAITIFEGLDDYKDALYHVEKCNYSLVKRYTKKADYIAALNCAKKSGSLISKEEVGVLKILNAKVGDTVLFGTYEQDNNALNSVEPIEWSVISVNKDEVTLLSLKNLVCKKYNEKWANVSWESCTLRTWLNEYFYNNAFNENEKTVLTKYYVTNDLVYILSEDEWKKYNLKNGTENTVYAISQGVYNEKGNGWTWLRDNGIGKDHAKEIDCEGNINTFGSFVDCDNEGVRPAIIICGGKLYE